MKFQKAAFDIWKKYIISKWPIYLLGAISVLLTNLMQVLAPKNIGWIIDFFNHKQIPSPLVGKDSHQTFIYLFLLLLASRFLINVFRFMWRITLGRQTHHACGMLKKEVWDHSRFYTKHDLSHQYTKGILMNLQVSDTNSARFIFGFTLVAIFDLIFLGIFTFLAMAMIHLPLAIISFLLLLFVPVLVRNLSKQEVVQYRKTQEALSQFNDNASQAIATIKLQRLTRTEGLWEKRLLSIANAHRLERLKGLELSLKYIPLMGVATLFSYVILFLFGIYFTFKNQMTIGEFISMQGLIFLLHDPLMSFGFVISEWKKAFAALERLAAAYSNEKDESLVCAGSEINLENEMIIKGHDISFSYNTKNQLISGFNIEIKKGDRLGITGPIGSGKTTLLNILTGLERNIDGKVEFLGKSFKEYSHRELRKIMAIVPQRPFLFATSIRENINLDNKLSDDEIWHYLELAGVKEDVANFPDQLDTELGEWGINLSGGQKQRMTLARALSRRPEVLFLDDCLSAVDTITEEKILKNLNNYLVDSTLIWVAHRKSTLKYCNQILELNSLEQRL
jgi:ATP-binding cassette subfamily B multidrug efflux pump